VYSAGVWLQDWLQTRQATNSIQWAIHQYVHPVSRRICATQHLWPSLQTSGVNRLLAGFWQFHKITLDQFLRG
jgi:hypothetical protein